jgi:hypothetical protein
MFSYFQRRGLFKDKKLDKLWHKAQKSGLTEEELMILKSEFLHHQVSFSHINLEGSFRVKLEPLFAYNNL